MNVDKRRKEVLLLRVKGYTIEEQAELLNVSESKVNKITRRLKIKYDALQDTIKELPKRKKQQKNYIERLRPLYFLSILYSNSHL